MSPTIVEDDQITKKPLTTAQLKKNATKEEKLAKFYTKQRKLDEQKALQALKPKEEKKETKPKEIIIYEMDTKIGDKKDVSGELPASYSPSYVEAAWYSWWEKSGFFKPEYNGKDVTKANPKGSFTIVIPPPNVTGTLHLGHALSTSVEDTLVRWHRMKGKTTLFNPGCDHAGIATQVVVEKRLKKEMNLSRHDLGREKFVEQVWKWRQEYNDDFQVFFIYKNHSSKGNYIYEQLKALGTSLDWDRACFTMDPVDKKELSGRTFVHVPGYLEKVEFGVLISFAYPISDADEELVVSTTRIETMLGDSAIAVHPNDERYLHLIGKMCKHPFIDRKLPIVADEFVDREFGTGAVKITPAHDQNDYDVGIRHNLPFITCIDDDGLISGNCGTFTGMKRFEARIAVLNALRTAGLYRDTKDNPMVIPICSRSKDVIEPILKSQWYVRCDEMARKATEIVKNGQLKLIPEFHISTWNRWMQGIRDWCISRQLWWGHRIPAYFITVNDAKIPPGDSSDNNYWVSGKTEEEALEKAAIKFAVAKEKITLSWDEDVLDTWFSSALFPFSIFGWPNDVYLHSMVRDAHGRKMSKTLGNVIDPIDVIRGISLASLHKQLEMGNLDQKELDIAKKGQKSDYPDGIPECGTDALRFALMAYTGQGRDINLDVLRVQGYRFFCNKIWQAVKFTIRQLGMDFEPDSQFKLSGLESLLDLWILSRLSNAVKTCENAFSNYQFQTATTACYNFWLYELCDIYLEWLKQMPTSNTPKQTLYTCVEAALRLISPFMPFLSEELWQRLKKRKNQYLNPPSICVAEYPEIEKFNYGNEDLDSRISKTMDIIKTVRSIRNDYDLLPKIKTDFFVEYLDKNDVKYVSDLGPLMGILASAKNVTIFVSGDKTTVPLGCIQATVSAMCKVHLTLQNVIDIVKEMDKLTEKRKKLQLQTTKLHEIINKADYNEKVPLGVRTNNQEKSESLKMEMTHLSEAINALELLNK